MHHTLSEAGPESGRHISVVTRSVCSERHAGALAMRSALGQLMVLSSSLQRLLSSHFVGSKEKSREKSREKSAHPPRPRRSALLARAPRSAPRSDLERRGAPLITQRTRTTQRTLIIPLPPPLPPPLLALFPLALLPLALLPLALLPLALLPLALPPLSPLSALINTERRQRGRLRQRQPPRGRTAERGAHGAHLLSPQRIKQRGSAATRGPLCRATLRSRSNPSSVNPTLSPLPSSARRTSAFKERGATALESGGGCSARGRCSSLRVIKRARDS